MVHPLVSADQGDFAMMLAGLIEANLHADPSKESLITRTAGLVGVEITDRAEALLLTFADSGISITTGPLGTTDLRIVGTADTIMGLSTTPLRFGLPDLLSSGGRRATGRWATGGLQVHGLPRGASLLRVTLGLLSVIA